MGIQYLAKHFAKIGAALETEVVPVTYRWNNWNRRWIPRNQIPGGFDIDIRGEGTKQERFMLRINDESVERFEFQPLEVRPEQRHLLLFTRDHDTQAKHKFLCGHDERHWFVCKVENSATNVRTAMESLQPAVVRQALAKHSKPIWNARRTTAFRRQGEWFFVPEPDVKRHPQLHFIVRNEPIRRSGGGKAHMVEELFRMGGQTVYVHGDRVLTTRQYERFIQRKPQADKWRWQVMRADARVYGRGKISHPDHATIILPFWHRILMNSEQSDVRVRFLD